MVFLRIVALVGLGIEGSIAVANSKIVGAAFLVFLVFSTLSKCKYFSFFSSAVLGTLGTCGQGGTRWGLSMS